MRSMHRVVVFVLLAMLPLASAFAAPKQGFGVYGGLASYGSSGEITKGSLDGESFSIKSSGLSVGGDYQLPLSDTWSLNFLFMSSSEGASSSELDLDDASHRLFGVEGRYWFGDYFAGAHVGQYQEVLFSKNDTSGGSGMGYGISVGWAKPDSGLFLVGQYDSANIAYEDATTNVSGFRANVGYRWGK